MVKWIMACVLSTSFPLSINGNIHGFFKGKRGLRQGDPLSPYLFTLVLEVLTLILQRRVRLSDSFRYHHHYEELQLINVCFGDDLFIFAHGDVESARVIMDSLEEFKMTPRLVSSIPKSTTYFCNVLYHTKLAILSIMPFSEGIVYDIQQLIRGFLWCNGEFKRGKYKVAWEGFHLNNKVADLVSNGAWTWPQPWLNKTSDLGVLNVPALDLLRHDVRQWHDRHGNLSSFYVAKAWEAIRPCGIHVEWFRIVWFSHNIPRHAFHI
ncbi:putative RNA-directed DNA polymerase, eukaryota, reverse transcriptase zinc-binding domain protein [Tanacetum coccineum]